MIIASKQCGVHYQVHHYRSMYTPYIHHRLPVYTKTGNRGTFYLPLSSAILFCLPASHLSICSCFLFVLIVLVIAVVWPLFMLLQHVIYIERGFLFQPILHFSILCLCLFLSLSLSLSLSHTHTHPLTHTHTTHTHTHTTHTHKSSSCVLFVLRA